jgi:hypothetical protein
VWGGEGSRMVREGGVVREREPEMEKKVPKQTDWRWGRRSTGRYSKQENRVGKGDSVGWGGE